MGAEMSMHAHDCVRPDVLLDDESEWTSQCSTPRTPRGNTIVLFDWDDTLLASSAVRGEDWCTEQLCELEQAVGSILRNAMTLGETLIVTNGNRTWVRDSAARFLPGLLPLLSELTVVSARALFEDVYPGDPFMWKIAAFEHLMTKERHFPAEPGLNLVALGDQMPEIDAARHVVQIIGGSSRVKTVKFAESPSVVELLGQLRRVEQTLGKIVQGGKSQSYGLVQQDPRPESQHTLSSASSWRCAVESECVSGIDIKDVWGLLA